MLRSWNTSGASRGSETAVSRLSWGDTSNASGLLRPDSPQRSTTAPLRCTNKLRGWKGPPAQIHSRLISGSSTKALLWSSAR